MKNSFISVIRVPDDIKIQTENSPLRYEEKGVENPTDARIQFEIKGDCLRVMLMPSKDAVKRIRMRFRGDLSGVRARLGDAWERSSTETMQWKAFVPHEMLPWYFYASDGARLHAYGVKTGGNSYALWQCDPCGITLTLDVRCGTDGVRVTEPLMCAEVICRRGEEGEEPFAAAREFCRMMCAHPNLPAEPVYGLNNWYWAYGNTDQQTLVGEARYLAQLSAGCAASPYMVMDDGWQICHTKGYNGGPWTACNERFSSMAETAAQIKAEGCRPGIWFRPLRTLGHVPQEAVYDTPYSGIGLVMDPTHPFTLQRVEEDAARLASWGFELIKHDFTTLDLYGRWIPDDRPLHFYDRSLTNAQIEKRIYETVQRGAGGAVVIGCNTCGHLAAGIHQVQRIGEDTSGRSFEWTRRGGNPQHDAAAPGGRVQPDRPRLRGVHRPCVLRFESGLHGGHGDIRQHGVRLHYSRHTQFRRGAARKRHYAHCRLHKAGGIRRGAGLAPHQRTPGISVPGQGICLRLVPRLRRLPRQSHVA